MVRRYLLAALCTLLLIAGRAYAQPSIGAEDVNAYQGGAWTNACTQSGAWSVRITDGTDTAEVLNLAANNPLSVAIVDGSGSQITSFGGGTQYTEDAAAAANPEGNAQILVRQDTPASEVSANGDNIARRGTAYGAAYSQIVTSTGSFVDTFGGGTQYTEGDTDATPTGTGAVWFDGSNNAHVTSSSNPLPVDDPNSQALLTNIQSNTNSILTSVQAIDTNTDGLESVIGISGAGTTGIGNRILGTDGLNDRQIKTDSSGELQVDVLTLPAITGSVTVSGTVAATQSGTWILGANSGVDIGDVTINNGSGASAVNIQDGGNSITVDNAALSVTGGGTEATAQRVTIANDSTGVLSVDDNGGSLTVDGTVAATQSGTWNIGTVTTVTNITNQGQLVDNAAFTDGTTRLNMAGYILDETAGTALTENDGAAARIDSKRAQVFTLEDATTRGRRATISASGGLSVEQATASNLNAQVVGSVAIDAASAGNPVFIGGRGYSLDPSSAGTIPGPSDVSTDADRTANFQSLKGGQVEAVHSVRFTPTNIATTYNNTTTTATSATIDAWRWRFATFGFTLSSANSPTDIQIDIEVSEDGSTFYKLKNGALGQWIYDDTYVASAKNLAYSFEIASRYIRITVTATGTDATNTFTMSNVSLHMRN